MHWSRCWRTPLSTMVSAVVFTSESLLFYDVWKQLVILTYPSDVPRRSTRRLQSFAALLRIVIILSTPSLSVLSVKKATFTYSWLTLGSSLENTLACANLTVKAKPPKLSDARVPSSLILERNLKHLTYLWNSWRIRNKRNTLFFSQ